MSFYDVNTFRVILKIFGIVIVDIVTIRYFSYSILDRSALPSTSSCFRGITRNDSHLDEYQLTSYDICFECPFSKTKQSKEAVHNYVLNSKYHRIVYFLKEIFILIRSSCEVCFFFSFQDCFRIAFFFRSLVLLTSYTI